jgi:hypothetical protein
MKFIQSGPTVELLTGAMSILEQGSEDDDGWQELYSPMRDKPLWQSSTTHIHNILTVSNRKKEGSGEWHIKLHVPNPACLETDPFCN